MDPPRACRECQTEIPPETPSGFCPRCLLALGLEAAEDPEPLGEGEAPPADDTGGVRRFGDYELQEEIARGGMGIVWRARQISLDRPVALKLILAGQMATEWEIQRFLREAQAAANLDHPNIVPIYEVGEHVGHHYFSMRLINGGSLAQRMADYQLTTEVSRSDDPAAAKKGLEERKAKAVTLIAQMARAVHHAHQRGVLHRDLKPANILIDARGEPFVTDFGLAKRVDSPAEMSRSDTVVGTPNYMSPEQARGRHKDLTTATDIFSLGAVLYHLLTGRPPFQGPTPWETLRQVVEQEPPRPSAVNRQVDPDLETICLKCLEKTPALRYASAEALADDLGRWLRHEPIQARPSTEFQKVYRWARRRPRVATLIGLMILASLAGSGAVLWEWRQAVAARGEALQQRGLARAAEQDAREKLWSSYLAQAQAIRWSGRPGRRFESLAAISNAAAMRPSMELRNEAIACLSLIDVRVRRQWRVATAVIPLQGLVFDARMERYAWAHAEGDTTIHRVADGREILKLPGAGLREEASLCFSPNGRFLAERFETQTTNVFRVWNLEDRQPLLSLPVSVTEAPLGFSPDSRRVATGQAGMILLYDLPSGREIQRIRVAYAPSSISFDPSGRRFVACGRDQSRVEVFAADTGRLELGLAHPAPVASVAWSPNPRLLACACWDARIYLWDTLTGKTNAVCAGHTGAAVGALFNRSGDLLVSVSFDGSTRFWDPATGEQALSVPAGLAPFSPFSPDDRRLGFRAGEADIGIWEVARATECRQWRTRVAANAVFLCAGRVLVTGDYEGLRFWDPHDHRSLGFLPLGLCRWLAAVSESQTLFACGEKGLYRIPLSIAADTGNVEAGPLERLWPSAFTDASLTHDGQTLVCSTRGHSDLFLFDLHQVVSPKTWVCPDGINSASISPDGRWVACAPSSGANVQVWDQEAVKVAKELPLAGNAAVAAFSPAGDRLVVSDPSEIRIWRTGSWELLASIPRDHASGIVGRIAISPDGRTLAGLRGRNHGIVLVALDSGRELATIDTGTPLGFGPDGAQLAAWNEDTGKLMLWDLRQIRRELTGLRLDWEAPPYAPPPD